MTNLKLVSILIVQLITNEKEIFTFKEIREMLSQIVGVNIKMEEAELERVIQDLEEDEIISAVGNIDLKFKNYRYTIYKLNKDLKVEKL